MCDTTGSALVDGDERLSVVFDISLNGSYKGEFEASPDTAPDAALCNAYRAPRVTPDDPDDEAGALNDGSEYDMGRVGVGGRFELVVALGVAIEVEFEVGNFVDAANDEVKTGGFLEEGRLTPVDDELLTFDSIKATRSTFLFDVDAFFIIFVAGGVACIGIGIAPAPPIFVVLKRELGVVVDIDFFPGIAFDIDTDKDDLFKADEGSSDSSAKSTLSLSKNAGDLDVFAEAEMDPV